MKARKAAQSGSLSQAEKSNDMSQFHTRYFAAGDTFRSAPPSW